MTFFVPPIMEDDPSFSSLTQLISVGRYIVSIVSLLLMVVQQRDRPIIWILITYQISVIISAMRTGTLYTTYLLSSFTYIGVVALILRLFIDSEHKIINLLYALTTVYLLVNLITKIVFPDGMLPGEVGDNREWFLGTKNHVTMYYILYTACLYYKDRILKKSSLSEKLVFVCLTLSLLYIQSSTAIVVALMAVPYVFVNISNATKNKIHILALCIVIGFLITVVILGTDNVLSSYISSIMGKNSSFTGRRAIWTMAIEMIQWNPNGIGVSASFNPWENATIEVFTAHNTFLDIAVRFGIVCSVIFMAICVYVTLKYSLSTYNPFVYFLICALAASLMEAVQLSYMLWIIIALSIAFEIKQNFMSEIKKKNVQVNVSKRGVE